MQIITKSVRLVWQNPYVTDGLVAMWDGEWNAGGGIHDPNATSWIDCVRGVSANSIGANPTWDSNCLNVTTTGIRFKATLPDPFLKSQLAKGIFTTEIVFDIDRSFEGNNHNLLCLYLLNQGGLNYPQLNISPKYGGIALAQGSLNGNLIGINYLGHPHSLTLKANSSLLTYFTDGIQYKTVEGDFKGNVTSDDIYLGTASYSTNRYFPLGRYFSYRIYSRVLTPAEIAANHEVDQERSVRTSDK